MPQPLDQPLELIRAADYWRYGIVLRVTCRCGRSRELAANVLTGVFGDEWRYTRERLEGIRPRLECGNCKAHWPQVALGVGG